jgi:biopolymer transport protein ExbD
MSPEIPTASMADIAFLLIIFFLVSTTMYQAKGIGLTLPAEGRQTKVRKRNIVHILVNSRGQMMIDGDQYPIPALEDIARRKIRENDKVIMSVKIDPQAQYSVMIDVVDELMKAGSRRISLVPPEM